MPRPKKTAAAPKGAASYSHPAADLAARPEIGTQAHFKKARAPATYRFDSSLAPELNWDGQNPAREEAEALLRAIEEAGSLEEARAAAAKLKALSRPFLNWSGKAERLSFDVPTLPLFVHERLSTRAILETLKGHKRDKQLDFFDSLFASPERSLADQVLKAYEHRDQWVNRLLLGDSLVVMNSLLRYESMGGQVQMIYMDPPYGVKFGSNFQPFVRKRDVKHNEDDDVTREPEMVQAYRDTWELGLHSYLTYLRDRLLLCRDLLAPTGSIFVQISDENLHHVREVMDEVFGGENFVAVITFSKTSGSTGDYLSSTCDYLLWYARDIERLKYRTVFQQKVIGGAGATGYNRVLLPDGTKRILKTEEISNPTLLEAGSRVYTLDNLMSQSMGREKGAGAACWFPISLGGREYRPNQRSRWKTNEEGMTRLLTANRLEPAGDTMRYVRYFEDFPAFPLSNLWEDTGIAGYAADKLYVVQTSNKVIQRCLLMTTDPGDLVLDPTCGSGTTAAVAEQWGRRWITMDTSRVPLALARQRLLTATYDYYQLVDDARGPAGGFVYVRRQNSKGEEVGGIVPHVTLKSIANNEPPAEEVLVDRPEVAKGVVRVTGPFVLEATIPTAEGLDEEPETPGIQSESHQTHVERMIEVLRRAPVLRLTGKQTVTLKQIRPPAKTLALSAEAVVDVLATGTTPLPNPLPLRGEGMKGEGAREVTEEPVAIVFGPENGPLSERLVREAWDEAGLKRYTRLFVIGFGIDSKAREFVEKAGQIGIPCVYLQASMDLQMGDLLKNMRSSQVFSVCGLPDVAVRAAGGTAGQAPPYEVELLGLDTFDPATMEPTHLSGSDVPAWFLDTDYNGLVFRVCQAFFPRTGAWESLKRALKAEFEDTVWEHLSGTVSAPFEVGDHRQIAVKAIDPRGNELLVVKKLEGGR
ncbi:MAG: site-specific DNA-methyltransferase [Deltaproteobacteria bacterium]|nr:site-specific DNA-methyltransferase [Deltaproteobacteria bacterium]